MYRPETTTRAGPSSAPAKQRTSRAAIWSLILSIVWLGGLGSLAAILLGVFARRRIATTGERGAGLAIAGIIIGIVTLIFAIVYWALIARHMGGYSGGGGHSGGGGYGY